MKVLIVISHNLFSGVNTWARTLQSELIARNIITHIKILSEKNSNYINEFNFFTDTLIQHFEPLDNPNSDYDVYIFNSNHHYNWFKNIKEIFVTHGFIEENGIPLRKPYYHVAISDFLKQRFNCDETIINGVDLNQFKELYKINKIPEIGIYISRENVPINLSIAAKEVGIQIIHTKNISDVNELINHGDFVIGYGRGIYEGMACNRPALVYGKQGCDGWINEYNFPILLHSNCSGFHTECQYNVDGLIELLKKYNPSQGIINGQLAKKFIAASIMGEKFENLIRRIMND